MKRLVLALAALLSIPSLALAASEHKKTYTLVAGHDLDGAPASATAIHSADAITDSASFTIDAQPDVPRLLQATLTDADSSISACTYVVAGTLADGTNVTATANLTGGSGAKALTGTVYFATVTAASVGICTGEGAGDTVSLGTTSAVATQYFKPYGYRYAKAEGDSAVRAFSLTWNSDERRKAVVDDNSVVSYDAAGAAPIFKHVSVGDIIQFFWKGQWYERMVSAKSGDDQLSLDESAFSSTDPVTWRFRKKYFGPDTEDGAFPVGGFEAGTFVYLFKVLGNDAKVRVQCRILGAGDAWVTVDNSAITASATLVTKVVTVDFRLAGYDDCRAGLEWSTTDADGDAGAELEDITVQFVGTVAAPLR